MSEFAPAVAITLKEEGGYCHNLQTGEVVNHGITLKLLRSLGILKTSGPPLQSDLEFVQSLTVEEATDIYDSEFWEKPHIGLLNSQDVANKVFDVLVNTGHGIIFLQRAAKVPADGILGPQTAAAANAMDPAALLATFRAEGRQYYNSIEPAADRPGWLARLNS